MLPKQQSPKLDIQVEVASATRALAPALRRLKSQLPNLDPKKIPIGELADTLYQLRQLGKTLNGVIAAFDDYIEPAVKLLEEYFVQTLAVGASSGVQGMKSRVQITESQIPVVKDWDKFYAHIARTKSFELLNRAVNRTAVTERWDNKKQVPGVDKFIAKKVSCTKLGGKA